MRRGHTNRKRTQFKAFAEAKAAYSTNRKSAREMANEWLTKELAKVPSDNEEIREEFRMLCDNCRYIVDEEHYWVNELRAVANA